MTLSVKHMFFLTLIMLSANANANAQRRIDMNFNGQMVSAVEDLKERMNADSELQGRKLRLGKFGGPNLPDSNFELAFERRFADLMQGRLDTESSYIVSGAYDFLPGERDENQGLDVIQFTLKVVNRQRRTMQTVTREINNSADIVKINGGNVALPDTKDVESRNKAAQESFEEPSFGIRNETQVTASNNRNYGVEIRRQAGGSGASIPMKPRDLSGMAFVDLAVTDTFSIVLFNYDTSCDLSAVVTIDGLDVANAFCRDTETYEGYVVGRAHSSVVPGQHVIPGWLETTQRSTGNVYQFVVNELGKGAATALQSRSRQGLIHVEFFEAVPPGQDLPSRRFGEVGKGKTMNREYTVKPMTLRKSPVANVSIRYRNPGQ